MLMMVMEKETTYHAGLNRAFYTYKTTRMSDIPLADFGLMVTLPSEGK